jgi:hypothetical protein
MYSFELRLRFVVRKGEEVVEHLADVDKLKYIDMQARIALRSHLISPQLQVSMRASMDILYSISSLDSSPSPTVSSFLYPYPSPDLSLSPPSLSPESPS